MYHSYLDYNEAEVGYLQMNDDVYFRNIYLYILT